MTDPQTIRVLRDWPARPRRLRFATEEVNNALRELIAG
jgi:hypothetical protein